MSFFDIQTKARRQSILLLGLYVAALAVLCTLTFAFLQLCLIKYHETNENLSLSTQFEHFWDLSLFAPCSAIVVVCVLSIAIARFLILIQDPESVLSSLQVRYLLPETYNPLEKILLNVVDEIAIAASMPAPRICVLDGDFGINAFAIGTSASNATIGVTQGLLECLDRSEMQAVIAHEISHIIHEDIQVNIGLLSIVGSLNSISSVGEVLLNEWDKHTSYIASTIGYLLYAIGSLGVLFSSLIKSAICREREYLADAIAIQLTRNPLALAGALKKIGAINVESKMGKFNELSHLFFAGQYRAWEEGLFAVHPPLKSRILALDPAWDGKFPVIKRLSLSSSKNPVVANMAAKSNGLAFAENLESLDYQEAEHVVAILDKSKDCTRMVLSRDIISEIPSAILIKLRNPYSVRALLLVMLINENPALEKRQMELVFDSVDSGTYQEILTARQLITYLKKEQFVPLVRLATPILRGLSKKQFDEFMGLVSQMIMLDDQVTLFEYCIYQMLLPNIKAKSDTITYDEAVAVLFKSLKDQVFAYYRVDQAVKVVAKAEDKTKRTLITELIEKIALDGALTVYEEQFISAVCAAIGVDPLSAN